MSRKRHKIFLNHLPLQLSEFFVVSPFLNYNQELDPGTLKLIINNYKVKTFINIYLDF